MMHNSWKCCIHSHYTFKSPWLRRFREAMMACWEELGATWKFCRALAINFQEKLLEARCGMSIGRSQRNKLYDGTVNMIKILVYVFPPWFSSEYSLNDRMKCVFLSASLESGRKGKSHPCSEKRSGKRELSRVIKAPNFLGSHALIINFSFQFQRSLVYIQSIATETFYPQQFKWMITWKMINCSTHVHGGTSTINLM